MNKANYLISRTFKGAMAFVLAVGLCPVAPAMAQEGATANEEGGAAAAVVDGAGASTDGAVAGATGGVAGSEADGVQPGGVSGDAAAAANGAGVGASAQDAAENDATDSGVSTDVVEAAAAADEGADESNDADAQTDGWQVWGGCEWMVDSEGCLTIRPKDGAEVGQLPNCYWYSSSNPWRADAYAQSIESVKVEKRVEASSGANGLFKGLSAAETMDLSGLDTSSATDMSHMFSGCSKLASLDLSGWDTSKATGMSYMFSGCSKLASLDLSGWDISSVADMSHMFEGCSSLASLDVSGWDTSSATSMQSMFSDCSSLGEVSLGKATRVGLPTPSGDGLTGRWVSSADGIAYRAADLPSGVAATYTVQHSDSVVGVANSAGGCMWKVGADGALVIAPLPGSASGEFNTNEGRDALWSSCSSKIISVRIEPGVRMAGVRYLFGDLSLVETMDLSGLDVPDEGGSVCDLSRCSSLREVTFEASLRVSLPTPSGDGLTGRWVSSVDGVAYRTSDLPSGVAATYAAQRSDSVVGVANSAGGCTWKVGADGALVIAPLPGSASGEFSHGWGDASWSSFSSEINSVRIEPGVTVKGSASGLFGGLSVADSMDLSGLDTSGVTDMSRMFSGCTLLQAVDLSSFDTSSVANMSSMFDGCESLGALDLSSFDTSKVENMSQMFQDCSSLASLGLSSFDTSSVAGSDGTYYYDGMWRMFQGCSSLTSLDLSSFNTSKVHSMREMFWNCKRLKSVNLSSFDTKNVACFESMFNGCAALESLDFSNFNTSRAVGSALSRMFQGCSSLKSLDVSSFDTSRITDFSSMFSGCDSLESLDLSSFDTTRATKMDHMFGYDGALSRVTLGEKFSFSKNGERLCSLPSNGGKVGWYDESVGKAYSVDEIPDNVATTYVKQKRLERDQFTVDDSRSVYTGAPIKKPIKSYLVEGVDYVVSYENNVGPGSAWLDIRGINRWYGELSYYFYIDGSAQRGQWMHDSNGWWYVDASGSYPSNEWRAIDGSYYYFNGSGYMCTNWLNYGGAWYWLGGSGAMATGWQSIGGSWYFFDDSGAMATGWKQIGGTYYYFNSSGAMQTGWLNTGGAWYYLSGSGAMATGWQTIGGERYHFDGSGAMASGWTVVDGLYYYFDGSGAMQTGWLNRGGAWYWLGDSGAMATGWQAIGGAKYWFDDSGAMATGWKWIGGSCYYFDGSGAMQANKWIDGSYVDSDGRWDQSALSSLS